MPRGGASLDPRVSQSTTSQSTTFQPTTFQSTPSNFSTQEDGSETLGSIDASGPSFKDKSSTTFLSFSAALFLMQIIV